MPDAPARGADQRRRGPSVERWVDSSPAVQVQAAGFPTPDDELRAGPNRGGFLPRAGIARGGRRRDGRPGIIRNVITPAAINMH